MIIKARPCRSSFFSLSIFTGSTQFPLPEKFSKRQVINIAQHDDTPPGKVICRSLRAGGFLKIVLHRQRGQWLRFPQH